MRSGIVNPPRIGPLWLLAAGLTLVPGCGRISGSAAFLPSVLFATAAAPVEQGGGVTGQQPVGGAGSRVNLDPCSESNDRKFIRISIRNLDPLDHIHYFLAFVAFVNGDTYPDGAVCPDDIDLYRQFGYDFIPEGSSRPFGNFCINGPALLYFHKSGQFRVGGGGAVGGSFGSAIPPAQGTNPTFDEFFTSAGARVPVPNSILWHNPGTGEGAILRVSRGDNTPCESRAIQLIDPECEQDAFYYVDEFDLQAGTNILGPGSGRRVPNEIQGTGCECGAFDPFLDTATTQVLAPSGATASTVACNEFLRGGMIEYVFIRDDRNPPVPQLLWRVTDQTGSLAHDFDSRVDIP